MSNRVNTLKFVTSLTTLGTALPVIPNTGNTGILHEVMEPFYAEIIKRNREMNFKKPDISHSVTRSFRNLKQASRIDFNWDVYSPFEYTNYKNTFLEEQASYGDAIESFMMLFSLIMAGHMDRKDSTCIAPFINEKGLPARFLAYMSDSLCLIIGSMDIDLFSAEKKNIGPDVLIILKASSKPVTQFSI